MNRILLRAVIVLVLLAPSYASAVTINFTYTGAQQNWLVPLGVSSVQIEAWGAQGYSTLGRQGIIMNHAGFLGDSLT